MFKRWLQLFVPSKQAALKSTPQFGGFRDYISHPDLWHFNHESVARGSAIGFFVAVLPIMPFQTILAIILSIPFRANVPSSIAFCWVNNPFTFFPMIYACYYLGSRILGTSEPNITHNLELHFTNFDEIWSNFSYLIVHFGKAYFIGLPFFAILMAVIGYCLVKLIWHVSILFKQKK